MYRCCRFRRQYHCPLPLSKHRHQPLSLSSLNFENIYVQCQTRARRSTSHTHIILAVLLHSTRDIIRTLYYIKQDIDCGFVVGSWRRMAVVGIAWWYRKCDELEIVSWLSSFTSWLQAEDAHVYLCCCAQQNTVVISIVVHWYRQSYRLLTLMNVILVWHLVSSHYICVKRHLQRIKLIYISMSKKTNFAAFFFVHSFDCLNAHKHSQFIHVIRCNSTICSMLFFNQLNWKFALARAHMNCLPQLKFNSFISISAVCAMTPSRSDCLWPWKKFANWFSHPFN